MSPPCYPILPTTGSRSVGPRVGAPNDCQSLPSWAPGHSSCLGLLACCVPSAGCPGTVLGRRQEAVGYGDSVHLSHVSWRMETRSGGVWCQCVPPCILLPWLLCLPYYPNSCRSLLSHQESWEKKKKWLISIISTASNRKANQTGISKNWDWQG